MFSPVSTDRFVSVILNELGYHFLTTDHFDVSRAGRQVGVPNPTVVAWQVCECDGCVCLCVWPGPKGYATGCGALPIQQRSLYTHAYSTTQTG